MPAAFSPETKIKNALFELNCPESVFARISGVVGKTRLAEGLAGGHDFAPADAEKMLTVIQEMKDLRDSVAPIPVAWGQVGEVCLALSMRRTKAETAEPVQASS